MVLPRDSAFGNHCTVFAENQSAIQGQTTFLRFPAERHEQAQLWVKSQRCGLCHKTTPLDHALETDAPSFPLTQGSRSWGLRGSTKTACGGKPQDEGLEMSGGHTRGVSPGGRPLGGGCCDAPRQGLGAWHLVTHDISRHLHGGETLHLSCSFPQFKIIAAMSLSLLLRSPP